MEKYITLENDYFQIRILKTLKSYGEEVLSYSTEKMKEYLQFFKESTYGKKIKGSFFTNGDDFFARIKELAPEATPSPWAKGCFYGGETQILLDEDNLYERFHTLAHETFHLLFKRFVYERNNMERIIWLDESLAGNFDGLTEKKIEKGEFVDIINRVSHTKKLPKMSDLDFKKNNVKTADYNGYDLFKIVGRYLIETKSKDELLEYVNDKDRVIKDGNNILNESLEYFKEKYNLD